MTKNRRIRIFLSSPGDVVRERAIVRAEIKKLLDEKLLYGIDIKSIDWDHPEHRTVFPATETPQETINQVHPSVCDIVIVILWSRMGTPLAPEKHGRKKDGTPYLSGTEWEYLNALYGYRSNGRRLPITVVYRGTQPVDLQPDQEGFKERQKQYARVQQFFAKLQNPTTRVFHNGLNTYQSIEEFQKIFPIISAFLYVRLWIGRQNLHAAPGAYRQQ